MERVPARVAEIGGIGEIGLWSGHAGGKRRNQRIEDGTCQRFRSGKEERYWLGKNGSFEILRRGNTF